MSSSKVWITAAVILAGSVVGCADGGRALSSPTAPGAVAATTPTVPASCAVPSAPGDLSASVAGTSVSLTWSPVEDADNYVVLVGRTASASDVLLTNTNESFHELDHTEPGTLFARVHAHNWCGTSESSKPISFTISR